MFRITILARRSKAITADAFNTQWLNVVCPALARCVANTPKLHRIVVNLPPDSLSAAIANVFPTLYDGMLELWSETAEAAAACIDAIAADKHVKESSRDVVDTDNSVMWLAEVVPSKPDSGSRVKFTAGGEVAHGVALEEAHRYWRDEHPLVAQTAPDVWNKLSRYTQFHGCTSPQLNTDNGLAKPRFVPMCSDMGFMDQNDFIALYTCKQYQQIVRPDEEKFSRPGEMLAFISAEERYLC